MIYKVRKIQGKYFLDKYYCGRIVGSQVFSTYRELMAYLRRNDIHIEIEKE